MGFLILPKPDKSPLNGPVLATLVIFTAFRAFSQGTTYSVELFPSVSAENIGLVSGAHLTYGLLILAAPSERFRAGLAASFANVSSEYDIIGSTVHEAIHVSLYQATLAYRIARIAEAIDLSAVASAGFAILTADEHFVSGGGFGLISVPGRNQRSGAYSLGLIASKELVQHVSVFISPRMLLLSPIQASSVGYSIGGGLSIGMF